MAEWMRDFVRATAEECKAPWSGGYNGKYFRCYFCGDKFVEGSEFRMIFTNDGKDGVPGGNPLTCRGCFAVHDGVDGLRQLWKERHADLDTKFWWRRRD